MLLELSEKKIWKKPGGFWQFDEKCQESTENSADEGSPLLTLKGYSYDVMGGDFFVSYRCILDLDVSGVLTVF